MHGGLGDACIHARVVCLGVERAREVLRSRCSLSHKGRRGGSIFAIFILKISTKKNEKMEEKKKTHLQQMS